MNMLQQIFNAIGRAFQFWVNDINQRRSCTGKGCSISIGLFIIMMACSIPVTIINTAGQAVGIIPTSTPRPSSTPKPTATPTSTPQPTATVTPTLEPVALTATAEIAATASVIAGQTATAEAEIAAQQTAEAAPTQTAEAIAAATATVEALDSVYAKVDIRDLVKAPDRYKGQNVKLVGEIFTIKEGESGFLGLGGVVTQIQIWVQIPGGSQFDREAVVVEFPGTLEGVYKGDTILVYGTGAGSFTGTNALGAEISQPAIKAEYVRW